MHPSYCNIVIIQLFNYHNLFIIIVFFNILNFSICFQLPRNEEGWKELSKELEKRWNYPHCIGAINGKHAEIRKLLGRGSYFFNYKNTFSVILMAAVNANYEFIMVDVGRNERCSDGGVFSSTKFFRKLQEKALKIPEPEQLQSTKDKMPFVFVADDMFPLMENLMKPYSRNNLNNFRRIAENAFGFMASHFQILLSTII
jgi:hypothetical protein